VKREWYSSRLQPFKGGNAVHCAQGHVCHKRPWGRDDWDGLKELLSRKSYCLVHGPESHGRPLTAE